MPFDQILEESAGNASAWEATAPNSLDPRAILLLGGTAEASVLAREITSRWPRSRLILSLAGRTRAPERPACEVRVGGFGGAEGLARFLAAEAITHLVDATHPYATGMSRNAISAAMTAETRRIALLRPPWRAEPSDDWRAASCLKAARDLLPPGARPFLALGRQHIAPFRHRPDLSPVVRMVDPPDAPLPFAADLVLGKPSADPSEEADLFRRLAITHLVCRNSGGRASYAKIEAARMLELPVVMIDRPPEPEGRLARSVAEVMGWLAGSDV